MNEGKPLNCRVTASDLLLSKELQRRNNNESSCRKLGLERLYSKQHNKGIAFSVPERQLLGLTGLLPPAIKTDEEQLKNCKLLLDRQPTNLDKYIFLRQLSQINEHLFYKFIQTDFLKMMQLIYTPTVGEACLNFSLISLITERDSGLYISYEHKGHIFQILQNWPVQDVRGICVTDGGRILGLGDLGTNGMPIPIGKIMLYTAVAGVKPNHLLPISLDLGTNTKSIRDDPLYVGLRRARVPQNEYDEFLEEFMIAVVKKYGQNCLIQFEDFGNHNAFNLLSKYQNHYCTFNDDIQGGAAVILAGLYSAIKMMKKKLKSLIYLFYGAGEVGIGTALILKTALMREGLTEVQARKHIWLIDSKGLIVKNRPKGGITKTKSVWAKEHEPMENLLKIVEEIKPNVLLGAAAQGKAFTAEVLQAMGKISERPIIFAFSNPHSKAECTAEEAYTNTEGRCIFGSGSYFAPVEYEEKWLYPSMANNCHLFPGLALGIMSCAMRHIPDDVFIVAAQKLSELLSKEELNEGHMFPSLNDLRTTSVEIAAAVMDFAYRKGLADFHPEPRDKINFLKHQIYVLEYPQAIKEAFKFE